MREGSVVLNWKEILLCVVKVKSEFLRGNYVGIWIFFLAWCDVYIF